MSSSITHATAKLMRATAGERVLGDIWIEDGCVIEADDSGWAEHWARELVSGSGSRG
jgi:hypothetical protein